MFNFNGITHVIKNPAGSYSLVGAVPVDMMTKREPTTSDVMGGRVQGDGFAYVGRAYSSIEEIKEKAAECHAHLCDLQGCACRNLF